MICIIVRQGQGASQDYDRLYEAFGHLVPVIWDRRRASDTAPSASYPNRRQTPPPSWTELGFVVVVDRSAAWAWTRAALSACEADHYIPAQAEPAGVGPPSIA